MWMEKEGFIDIVKTACSNHYTVSEEEIFQALSQIGGLRAPGPDGIHAIFSEMAY
ncbi:hypothetical protein OROMI_000852 [Orobanche minor]